MNENNLFFDIDDNVQNNEVVSEAADQVVAEVVAAEVTEEPVAAPVSEPETAPATEPQVCIPVYDVQTPASKPVAEEAPAAKEEEAAAAPPAPAAPDFDADGIVAAIDAHFTVVKNMLKYNKDKDANINKLNAELQKYREGYQPTLFRSLALNIVGYREDCRKSYREFEARELSVDDSKKYLGYIVLDYEDMLENLNIKVTDSDVKYNGISVNAPLTSRIKLADIPEFELGEMPVLIEQTPAGVSAYLEAVQQRMTDILANNSAMDKVLATYIAHASLYEQGVQQVVLYPVIKKIVSGYRRIVECVEDAKAKIDETNAKSEYLHCLLRVIDMAEIVLALCGVSIDSYVGEKYDPKRHRLLKTVKTENAEDNEKIVTRYSDCYVLEDKVIYPQKVDVYKF